MQLLVLKAFLKDFERFRLAHCSPVHLFSDCSATNLMNGKWGHNLVGTRIVSFKRNTLLSITERCMKKLIGRKCV